MANQDDLMERGFHLAYFIFPSRTIAIRILTDALNKLKAQRGRENRRVYWRDKYLKRAITRITREEADALQWLIFFESDRYEKEQESSGDPAVSDLVVRYIKNLVRMTTAMSSFHVNVGLHRLLHNYSTAETQRTYETVTERFLGADEYRRAKSVLMNKLGQRFDGFLKTQRTQHGELRFEECDDQRAWLELVEACLAIFTPWSTCEQCPVPAAFDPDRGQALPQLSEKCSAQLGHDQVEISRCHVFIDPVCYTRLAAALALDPPEKKLALPRFFMDNNRNDRPTRPPQPSVLSSDERHSIQDQLIHRADQRTKTRTRCVKVFVDGRERVQLQLAAKGEASFVIAEGSELVEIRTADPGQAEEILLATQRVPHSEQHGVSLERSTIFLRGGNRLVLSFAPLTDVAGESEAPRQGIVRLSFEPAAAVMFWKTGRDTRWIPALGYSAAAVLLLALGWLGGTRTIGDVGKPAAANFRAVEPAAPTAVVPPSSLVPQTSFVPQPNNPAEKIMASASNSAVYKLVSEELITRGPGGVEPPSVRLHKIPEIIALELPIGPEETRRSLRAVLQPLDQPTDILSVSLTAGRSTKTGAATVLYLPSPVLEANRDYSVTLQSRRRSGKFEEVGRYVFHTSAAVQ